MQLAGGLSRREFLKGTAASLALACSAGAKTTNRVNGVYVGLQTFSLRMLRYEAVIAAMQELGIRECELVANQIEPAGLTGLDLLEWRQRTPMTFYKDIRKQFNDAGVEIYAFTPTWGLGGGRAGAPPVATARGAVAGVDN